MLAISKVSLFAFFALISVAFSKSVDPLIVGGEQADIADFPHQLALINLRWNGHWCGASNIHRLWALSAAHCIPSNIPADLLNLQGGSTSRLSGQQTFFITRYTIHPDYDRRNLANDIVILEVDVSSESVQMIKTVELTFRSNSPQRLWKGSLMFNRFRSHQFAIQNAVEHALMVKTSSLQAGATLTMVLRLWCCKWLTKLSWTSTNAEATGVMFHTECFALSLRTEETAVMETVVVLSFVMAFRSVSWVTVLRFVAMALLLLFTFDLKTQSSVIG